MAGADASTLVWLNRPHHRNVNNCDECCVGCCKNSNNNSYNNSYRNSNLIKAARVLSVVSVSVSWIYRVTFAFGLVGMAVIQTLGRRRITDDYFRCASFGAWIAAFLCALAQFWLALNIYNHWSGVSWCDPWTLESGGRFDNRWDPNYSDSCPHKTWASVALVCGILWTMVFGCLVRFRIVNGRFHNHNDDDNDNDDNNDDNSRNSLITDARVLSVVSIAVSWIWWVTFAIGLVGMAVIQILGRRNTEFYSSIAMLGAQFTALVCAVAQFWLAHHIYSDWWDVSWCDPWTLETGAHLAYRWDPRYSALCPHKSWASVAVVCGIIWTMVLGCLVRFRIVHGRFQNHNSNNNSDSDSNTSGTNANANNNKDATEAVESGNEAPAEPAASVAIPLAESTEVESC